MKKLICLLLAMIMVIGCVACGSEATEATETVEEVVAEPTTRTFTDSTGREVEVPAEITKVAASGPLAQMVLFSLCPDKMVGIATEWNDEAEQYLDANYYALPVLGQLYGGKGDLNPESLIASGAEIVIDVGEAKDGVKEDMDSLTEQTGITFVHISADLSSMSEAYTKLGELLGLEEEAKALADFCDKVYEEGVALSEKVEKVNLLYVTGEQGLNVIAQSSYHAEVIDLLGNNLAVVDSPSSKGTGNEVSMEQILAWNPDVVIFSPESIYATVTEDETWSQVKAIQDGAYYEVPFGPYNWMGFPPSVQRYLGILWMSQLLYPEECDFDLCDMVKEYYSLFYHCELTDAQYDALMANSIGKVTEKAA